MTTEERKIEALETQIKTLQGTIVILEADNYEKSEKITLLEKSLIDLIGKYGELLEKLWKKGGENDEGS